VEDPPLEEVIAELFTTSGGKKASEPEVVAAQIS
jgi:hypothetical protein